MRLFLPTSPAASGSEPPAASGSEPPAASGSEPPAAFGSEHLLPPAANHLLPPAANHLLPPAANHLLPPAAVRQEYFVNWLAQLRQPGIYQQSYRRQPLYRARRQLVPVFLAYIKRNQTMKFL
jgi:hypothetical protein